MARIKRFTPSAMAALIVTICGGYESANAVNAGGTAEKTAPRDSTKAALVSLEKSAYEAWKTKDASFWDAFLSDRFVGWGSSGRLNKASATKEYTGADCEIRSYALSDEQMRLLRRDVALITFKTTIDGTCGGRKVPANSWAAAVYVGDGDQWKGAFHADAPIADPKVPSAKPVDQKEAVREGEAQRADRDAGTGAMLAIEKTLWEAWRTHDGKQIADLTAEDVSFINIFGTYLPSKADALKDWTGTGCDVKSISVTNATRTMLSPTAAILTFKATADGTCYGQVVNSVIWGSSVYVKHGNSWKWTFGINVPARGEGT